MSNFQVVQESLQKSFDPTFGNYLLHGIEEVYLPETIVWWPHTLGWKILLVGLVCWLGLLIFRLHRRWRGNRYRRQALSQLEEMRQTQASLESLADKTGLMNTLQQLPALLKATALHAYPRSEIAQLSGTAWLRYLNQRCRTTCFDAPTGALLLAIAYQPAGQWQADQDQLDALFSSCQQWIQQHRAELDPSGVKHSDPMQAVVKNKRAEQDVTKGQQRV